MEILIVTFQLHNLTEAEYAAHCAKVAPHFATLPGLFSKIWLADQETNTYGGVYLWESRADLDRYLVSDTFRAIGANPHFVNVHVRSFGSLAEANAVTAALPPVATQFA